MKSPYTTAKRTNYLAKGSFPEQPPVTHINNNKNQKAKSTLFVMEEALGASVRHKG